VRTTIGKGQKTFSFQKLSGFGYCKQAVATSLVLIRLVQAIGSVYRESTLAL